MRTVVAHVYRLLAADLRPAVLQEDTLLRNKIFDWIIDTLKYLQAGTAGHCLPCLHCFCFQATAANWLQTPCGSRQHKHAGSAQAFTIMDCLQS